MDEGSDLIIVYMVSYDANRVKEYAFSEEQGFIHSDLILNPIDLSFATYQDTYLGTFCSTFNESYSIGLDKKADLWKGFTGISPDNVKIFSIDKPDGVDIDDTYILYDLGDRIQVEFGTTASQTVYITYGIVSYKLDRGYQQIAMNMYDAVRKLSKYDDNYQLYNYYSSLPMYLCDIPDDPEDPLESNSPKIIIPLLKENKTTITFDYLVLMYNTRLNGTFYLDDCALEDKDNKRPIFVTFTFTIESGEEYFDFMTIDPSTGKHEYPFEVSLQPIYAVEGYTTFDIEINFISQGENSRLVQYVILDNFELTADDRILETVSRPMIDEQGNLKIKDIISSPNWVQIFTDRLSDAYGIIDESWLTLAIEGFNGYADLVRLYKDENNENKLALETQTDNEYYFQSLEMHDRRLIDSMALHLNAYDLKLPEYLEGEVNLYAGKGKYVYGEVYESDIEYTMNWDGYDYNGEYTVDVEYFDASTYNGENFFLSNLPLTSQELFIEGEVYMHHRIDLSLSENVITENLPAGVEFAILIHESTERFDFVEVSYIDRIATPWDWCESWQGYSLVEEDFFITRSSLSRYLFRKMDSKEVEGYLMQKFFNPKRVGSAILDDSFEKMSESIKYSKVDSLGIYIGEPSNINFRQIKTQIKKVIEFFKKETLYQDQTVPELVLGYYLKYLFGGEFTKSKRVEWLVGVGGNLDLDLHNDDLGIAGEFNGPQHYLVEHWIKRYSLTPEIALQKLTRYKVNDLSKLGQCKEHGKVLIVISCFDDPRKPLHNWQKLICKQYELWTGEPAPEKPILSIDQVLELLSRELEKDSAYLKYRFFRTFDETWNFLRREGIPFKWD